MTSHAADKVDELLTNEEMASADRAAIAGGVAGLQLMETAGRAVADAAERLVAPAARLLIACGPGNNGGDGFVAARLLRDRGYDVTVALLGKRDALTGDAGEMAKLWFGDVEPLTASEPGSFSLIIDAIFGAGLARPISPDSDVGRFVASVNASDAAVLAVDVPTGLDGSTGAAPGCAIKATTTVTFCRRKPGHLLLPGRELCGSVTVADIGISDEVIRDLEIATFVNTPALWRHEFPIPKLGGHKYERGHTVVVSGALPQAGAARLGARGALRAGAGLVTLASPDEALPANAAHLNAIMLTPCNSARELARILEDERKTSILLGPGCGVGETTRSLVLTALGSPAGVVLDADALTSFAGAAKDQLKSALISDARHSTVITPHEGEFERVFGFVCDERGGSCGSKLDAARRIAAEWGTVVVLKGADTVVAAPDGRAAINENAPPDLATAGSGDVLAGFIAGLLGQKMPAFEAACAGVWLHGACGGAFGPGLIAEDLPEMLPSVLRQLQQG